MPGQERLKTIVRESIDRAKLMADNIDVAARHPNGATEATVDNCAGFAHDAIDRAAEAAKVLVRESDNIRALGVPEEIPFRG